MDLYQVQKIGGYWTVSTRSGVVQYRSASRRNCLDWIAENDPKPKAEAQPEAVAA